MNEEKSEGSDGDKKSCNNDSEDEDMIKIKGDAIGNTLYSERWVLKTLIKLSKFSEENWNPEYEEEICLLWDMTIEKDVTLFLHQHDFYSIFITLIESKCCNNNRLMEIMIGILGNMCSLDIVREALSQKEDVCIILLKMLSLEDSLTLIQLIRLLNTCLWSAKSSSQQNMFNTSQGSCTEEEKHIHEDKINNLGAPDRTTNPWIQSIASCLDYILHQIKFFLFSSTNEELLCLTLEFIDTLINIRELKAAEMIASSCEIITGLTECLKQLLKTLKPGDSIMANKRLWRGCAEWNDITSEIILYKEGSANLELTGTNLIKCLMRLLQILTNSEAIRAQDSDVVSEFLKILENLDNLQIESYLVSRLVSVLYVMSQETSMKKLEGSMSKEGLEDLTQRIKKLFQRILSKSDDLHSIFVGLKDFELEFVCRVANEDEAIKSKVTKIILNVKTNGLV